MTQPPEVIRDGPYETRISFTHRTARLQWHWVVTHQESKAQRAGRSSSVEYARHDARRAVEALRREAQEASRAQAPARGARSVSPVQAIEVPEAWQSSPIQFAEQVLEGTDDLAGKLAAVGMVLRDGTNIMLLVVGASRRWARFGPPTDWRLEERFEGPPVRRAHEDAVSSTWRVLLECMIAGRDATSDELGGLPS